MSTADGHLTLFCSPYCFNRRNVFLLFWLMGNACTFGRESSPNGIKANAILPRSLWLCSNDWVFVWESWKPNGLIHVSIDRGVYLVCLNMHCQVSVLFIGRSPTGHFSNLVWVMISILLSTVSTSAKSAYSNDNRLHEIYQLPNEGPQQWYSCATVAIYSLLSTWNDAAWPSISRYEPISMLSSPRGLCTCLGSTWHVWHLLKAEYAYTEEQCDGFSLDISDVHPGYWVHAARFGGHFEWLLPKNIAEKPFQQRTDIVSNSYW